MLELSVLITVSLLNGLLGLVVFLKNRHSATSRLFFFATTSFITWSVVNYISIHPVGLSQLYWVRLVLFFAAILCLSINLTFRTFPDHDFPKPRWLLLLTVVATILVAVLTLTPLIFRGLIVSNGAIQPVVSPAVAIFALYVISTLGGALFSILRKYRHSTGRTRAQYRLVLYGITGTFSLIVLTNFGLVVLLGITTLVPFGASFTLLFSGSLAYAIIRHRLLDIRSVVARSVAYVLLLLALAVFYALCAYSLSTIFFSGGGFSQTQLLANVGLALILAFTFQPLRRFFERLTNKLFYRDHYDSPVVIQELTKVMASELHLGRLLDETLSSLCQSLHVSWGQFIVFDQNKIYKVAHYGPLPNKLIVAAELKHLNKPLLVADELEGGERKNIMDVHSIRVSEALRTKEQFVGFLILGDKKSGDIYSSQDLEVLQILAGELAVAVLNAKAYEQIARFNITLQEKIREATHDLRGANRHLKELDQAKDEFISMASHQLRTPLTTVKGYLSMLIEGDVGQLNPQQKEFLNYAFTGSERMVGLISDLLNVSRLAAGKFMIERQPTDLVAVTADEVQQLQTHAQAKNIALIFQPPAEPLPPVNIDEGKTRQVIMNFIDNAVYYTPKGNVTVTLTNDEGRVRLQVRDTGIGVPKAARDKLFTKFYRAGNAQTVRPDGTGLGLFLAKRVIEEQGGTIIFDSVEGQGSTFGFELPVSANLPAAKKVGAAV